MQQDCFEQFKQVTSNINNKSIIETHSEDVKKAFSYLYIINFISKKVELKRFFNTTYYNVSYSCLIECFTLLLEGYPRGSALVLRSSLENFVKSVIEVVGQGTYSINDRSYSVNRQTLDNIIENEYPEKYKALFKRTNAQMHNLYGKLSGLSHSLTPESQNNLLKFFSDISITSKDNIDTVVEKFLSILEYIFQASLLVARTSLEVWERGNLEEVVSFVFGKKRSASTLTLFTP